MGQARARWLPIRTRRRRACHTNPGTATRDPFRFAIVIEVISILVNGCFFCGLAACDCSQDDLVQSLQASTSRMQRYKVRDCDGERSSWGAIMKEHPPP